MVGLVVLHGSSRLVDDRKKEVGFPLSDFRCDMNLLLESASDIEVAILDGMQITNHSLRAPAFR